MTQLRMLSMHASHPHYNSQMGHTFLWLWKESVENITQWCGVNNTWDPAPFSASSSKWQRQNSVGVGGRVSDSKHTPAPDVTKPRLPLGILNSGESLALIVTIHNQNFRRGKTPRAAENDTLQRKDRKMPGSHSLNLTMSSFREKRAVQLFWVTINVSHLETERMTQESTTYPGNGVTEAAGGEGLWVRLKGGGDETGESCFLKVDVLLKYFWWQQYSQKARDSKQQRFLYLRVSERLSPEIKELDLTIECV